jgi:hypothetical protein
MRPALATVTIGSTSTILALAYNPLANSLVIATASFPEA